MNIRRMVVTFLFCIAMLFAAGKKAEAAFPYNMKHKPVTATSIKSEKVSVYEDDTLKSKTDEVNGAKLSIEAYQVSGKSIYGKYKSGKKSGEGWFSLDTFVVNPDYKNVYATVREKMHIYTNRRFSKVQTTIKKYSGIIVISKKDGDRQVICDKKDHYEIGWMTANAFSNTLIYDGREKQTVADGIYEFRCGYQDDENGGLKEQTAMDNYKTYTLKIMHITRNRYYIQNVENNKYLSVRFKKTSGTKNGNKNKNENKNRNRNKNEKGKAGSYQVCWTEKPDETYGQFELQRLNGAFSIQNVENKYFLAQSINAETGTKDNNDDTADVKNIEKQNDATIDRDENKKNTEKQSSETVDTTALMLEKGRITEETHWRIHPTQKVSNTKKPFVFTQYDPQWCATPYGGGGCMGTAGCGILATVNAVYALSGQYMDVMELANYAVEKNYRIVGSGTDDGIFKAAAKKYGRQYGFAWDGKSGSIDVLKKKLKAGDTAIVHVQGHYVAISDYNKKTKKYLLLDSNYLPKRATSAFGDWIKTERLLSGALESQCFYFFKLSKM